VDVWRRPERFEQLLLVAKADSRGRTGFEQCDYPQVEYLQQALQQALTITAKDVMVNGITGAEIRPALAEARKARLGSWKAAQVC
jgi:tRNA nucleotidyltransferase (CCA-adding enzyme)